MQPKALTTTKRATKALLIVDPNTNVPLDLVGISSSSKSKPPEPASVTSPTQDAKREEFMAKIGRKFSTSEDYSQPEPTEPAASSTQRALPHTTKSTLRADSTSSKDLSRFVHACGNVLFIQCASGGHQFFIVRIFALIPPDSNRSEFSTCMNR